MAMVMATVVVMAVVVMVVLMVLSMGMVVVCPSVCLRGTVDAESRPEESRNIAHIAHILRFLARVSVSAVPCELEDVGSATYFTSCEFLGLLSLASFVLPCVLPFVLMPASEIVTLALQSGGSVGGFSSVRSSNMGRRTCKSLSVPTWDRERGTSKSAASAESNCRSLRSAGGGMPRLGTEDATLGIPTAGSVAGELNQNSISYGTMMVGIDVAWRRG